MGPPLSKTLYLYRAISFGASLYSERLLDDQVAYASPPLPSKKKPSHPFWFSCICCLVLLAILSVMPVKLTRPAWWFNCVFVLVLLVNNKTQTQQSHHICRLNRWAPWCLVLMFFCHLGRGTKCHVNRNKKRTTSISPVSKYPAGDYRQWVQCRGPRPPTQSMKTATEGGKKTEQRGSKTGLLIIQK